MPKKNHISQILLLIWGIEIGITSSLPLILKFRGKKLPKNWQKVGGV